ncbi:MAG: 30S ribosomal protein S2 [Candidatus Nealsonbacteria bacterium]|nr:30S ribosomal protein S2 [Candidatus Nealsonbacteria bacterium]
MLEAGLHFGHSASTSHPRMKPFLFGTRNGVQIIDLEKASEKFEEALKFIQKLTKEGGTLLLVGTKIHVRKMLKETAEECGLPYVSERWLGGTFTNFETIKKRVNYLKGLEKKKAEGLLDKYTKKEKAEIEKEIKGLEERLGGIKNLETLPQAIFVCDMKKDLLAVREARQKNVKIIGLADTNIDPSLADYPIPANDDAANAVKYILDKIKETVLNNQVKKVEESDAKH